MSGFWLFLWERKCPSEVSEPKMVVTVQTTVSGLQWGLFVLMGARHEVCPRLP